MVNSILIGILAGLIFLILCIGVFAIKKTRRPFLVITYLYVLTSLLAIVFQNQILNYELFEVSILDQYQVGIFAALSFFVMAYCYLQVYGFIEFSITFRMLRHFLEAQGHTLSLAEMNKIYPFSEIIERKIRDGIKMGAFVEKQTPQGVGYLNRPTGRLSGLAFNSLRKVLNMELGG